MAARYRDRTDAGRALAAKLATYANRPDVLVLALPRGGVPVAYEVARALGAPLDVFGVRKLGVPGHEEFAMGALGSGGLVVLNPEVLHLAGVSDTALRQVIERERRELQRRERVYRGDRAPLDVSGKTVILVDDGLATGSTMRAAVAALKQKRPARIVVAVPVAAPDVCESLRKEVDEVVCTATPEPFRAVGLWYDEFPQTSDEEVHTLMDRAETAQRERPQGSDYAERR